MTGAEDTECDGCGACVGRREFVVVGLSAALAAFLPSALRAAPVTWIQSSANGGGLRYPVPTEDGVSVDRQSEVILVRYQGSIAAFALSCPHQRSMLRWRENKGNFQCTKHHSEYAPMGEFQKGRATRNMDRLGIQLVGTEVVVDRSKVFQSDQDAAGWAQAVVKAP